MRVIASPAPIVRAVLEPVAPRDWEVNPMTQRCHKSRDTPLPADQVIGASAAFLESALVAQAGSSYMTSAGQLDYSYHMTSGALILHSTYIVGCWLMNHRH